MLGYLHEFHAGNHADVLKHLTLTLLLQHLARKEKPYTFFDTHAGSARYDVGGERAAKTGEASRGIIRLLAAASEHPADVPPQLCAYLSIVQESLSEGFYPGSPEIERRLLLPGSRLVLSELHSAEYVRLKEFMKRSGAQVHHRDGWELLNALTPPPIVRGAALCDPSYELPDDYGRAAEVVSAVHKKWGAAAIALWYPLLSYRSAQIERMKRRIVSAVKA
ncbi:MAG: 23S rRNA (adenine(2030)-N(6))-methyltransferase RlmJ, partial [Treponemataceae bacterium]|nr:23S rRNA (adenine(2030)-N(6))-methyltransferase RlmJ [Treponemataceae bacterium]